MEHVLPVESNLEANALICVHVHIDVPFLRLSVHCGTYEEFWRNPQMDRNLTSIWIGLVFNLSNKMVSTSPM